MSDSLFYTIAYILPVVVGVVFGVLVIRRTQLSSPAVRRISLAVWIVISLFTVAAGFVAGRLYSYVSTHELQSQRLPPSLPLRPGAIVLGFVVLQVAMGFFLRWWASRSVARAA